ncbi:hypothetical protein LSH36_362g03027 [Paralvinella palmiformis]|uniref:Uncharacterized protein n=1 Tax=Paralvinella palmiformis TaxID=53620 RepID=A0AAD9JEJ9_9ANNE|nr:hypothetical protein LSH36_362g03027 [Paralvinella palmiformis]
MCRASAAHHTSAEPKRGASCSTLGRGLVEADTRHNLNNNLARAFLIVHTPVIEIAHPLCSLLKLCYLLL